MTGRGHATGPGLYTLLRESISAKTAAERQANSIRSRQPTSTDREKLRFHDDIKWRRRSKRRGRLRTTSPNRALNSIFPRHVTFSRHSNAITGSQAVKRNRRLPVFLAPHSPAQLSCCCCCNLHKFRHRMLQRCSLNFIVAFNFVLCLCKLVHISKLYVPLFFLYLVPHPRRLCFHWRYLVYYAPPLIGGH